MTNLNLIMDLKNPPFITEETFSKLYENYIYMCIYIIGIYVYNKM